MHTTSLNILLADVQVHLFSIICTALVLLGRIALSTACDLKHMNHSLSEAARAHIQIEFQPQIMLYMGLAQHVIDVWHSTKAYISSNTC